MKYGVSLFPLRPQQIIDVAQHSEELGFDSLWLGEHVVTPVESDSRFPYAGEDDDSHDAFHANLPFYDPYAVLAYLAAITKTVKLAVSVSIVPLHDPFHLARSVTTLDLFSGGRFILGAGGGWLKEEFEILGRDFDTRGKRFDETLDVMVSLFTNDVTEYDGQTLKVPAVGMSPKPQTRPHPPFVFGGHAKPALRRAAQRGNGWLASELSPEEIAPLVETLRQMREDAGRFDMPFEISCAVMGEPTDETIAQYAAAGVDRLVVRPWLRGRDAVANLTTLAGRAYYDTPARILHHQERLLMDVAIIGVGETTPVRADPRPAGTMIAEAVRQAIADAGITADRIDGFVTESATMPQLMPAEHVIAALGAPMPVSPFIAYSLHYGAGLVAAAELAGMALSSGRAKYVLCWYGHQLSRQAEGPRTLYANDPLKANLEMPGGWFGQPIYFAGIAQRYAHEFGLPAEALAAIAIEAREHAARTPGAMKTAPLDMPGYLASPSIATPLRGPDCALVNDGAVAFVMTTLDRARDCPHPVVRVAGVGVGSSDVPGDTWFTQNRDYLTTPAAISGPAAFRQAGMTPQDVDFAELYDCFSINTLLQYEDLGFVQKGEGAVFAIEKGRGLTDRLPTNTHGGLLSHSFLLGGGHILEAVRQLRHARGEAQVPDARIGLVTALGIPHHSTMLLERM